MPTSSENVLPQKWLSCSPVFITFQVELIVNRVSKQPVLAIETDGYSFHNDETEQHKRDLMKDHILSCYGLPLLRLSTKGSGEREKVVAMLNQLI